MSSRISRVHLIDSSHVAWVTRKGQPARDYRLSGRAFWLAVHTMMDLTRQGVFFSYPCHACKRKCVYLRVTYRKERAHD